MHGILIVNPTARGTNRRTVRAVRDLLAGRFELDVQSSRRRGHVAELVRGGVDDGAEVVVALGGDGTVNEAVQALAMSDAPLVVVPAGGANVFARALGVPNDPLAAAHAYGNDELVRRAVSLGRIDERWFACNAGFGFEASVVHRVERDGRLKRVSSTFAYVLSAIAEWLRRNHQGIPSVTVQGVADGDLGPFAMAIVANTSPYTYLGERPVNVHPNASFDRGLDVLTVEPTSTRRLIGIVQRVMRNGSHVSLDGVGYLQDLATFVLTSPVPLPLMVDGEYVGRRSRVRLTGTGTALEVLVPQRTLERSGVRAQRA